MLASHSVLHANVPLLLPGVVSPWPPFALILPTASILCPELVCCKDNPKERCSPYIAALDACIALYGGKSTPVGSSVLQLRSEAQRIALTLTLSEDELDLFPHVTAAIARLWLRMLISLSRGHSLEENEDTGRLIPEILATDTAHLSQHISNFADDGIKCETNSTVLPKIAVRVNESVVESAFSCVFPLLVGMDFGGSAYKGELKDILPLLQRLRSNYSLLLTIHGSEKKNDE